MKQFEHIFLLPYVNVRNSRCSVNSLGRENRTSEGDKGNAPRGRIETEKSLGWAFISGQEIRLLVKS